MEQRAIALFAAQANQRWEAYSRIYLAQILLRTGDPEEAEEAVRRAVEMLAEVKGYQVWVRAILAQVLLTRGRPTVALAEAREAMAMLAEFGEIEEGEALIRAVHAEALWATGDHKAARAAIADARDRLLAAAARIQDPRRRDSFLRNVPENARTLELWRAWLGEDTLAG